MIRHLRGNIDVVAVTMRQNNAFDVAVFHGTDDGIEFMRRVDDPAILVADDEDVVVDVPFIAVEFELSRSH